MSQSDSDDIADCTPPTVSRTTTSVSTNTHEVWITLSLSMSHSAFTKDKQTDFKDSLAQAAGVASKTVVINKVETIRSLRHLLSEAICVESSIMVTGEAAAQELAGRLTSDSINRELSKAGLPTATVLEIATPARISATGIETVKPGLNSSITSPELSSFFSTPVLVGGILVIVFLAGIVTCFCRWKYKNLRMAFSLDSQIIPATLEMGEIGNGNLSTSPNEIPTTLETVGTLTTSVNESPVFDDLEVSSAPRLWKFPGTGELQDPLDQDADQHAGPGQVQTNQQQDKESESIVLGPCAVQPRADCPVLQPRQLCSQRHGGGIRGIKLQTQETGSPVQDSGKQ
jgi:hypothetical protein